MNADIKPMALGNQSKPKFIDYSQKTKTSDVIITCADGIKLYYSRFIFDIQKVDYFNAILSDNWRETDGMINLNYNSDYVKLLLNDICYDNLCGIVDATHWYEYIKLLDEVQYKPTKLRKHVSKKLINDLKYNDKTIDQIKFDIYYDLLLTRPHILKNEAQRLLVMKIFSGKAKIIHVPIDILKILVDLAGAKINTRSCVCEYFALGEGYIEMRTAIGPLSVNEIKYLIEYYKLLISHAKECYRSRRCGHLCKISSFPIVIGAISRASCDDRSRLDFIREFTSVTSAIFSAMYQ